MNSNERIEVSEEMQERGLEFSGYAPKSVGYEGALQRLWDGEISLDEFNAEVVLNIGDLHPEEIGVELLFAMTDSKGKLHIQEKYEFTPVELNVDGVARYQAQILPERTGMYQVAARIYAKNSLLPHRQDFELVKWL